MVDSPRLCARSSHGGALGALRGCGWSLPPALATLGCVVGSRMIWIFTVFNEHLLYDVLLAIYQLS